MSLYIGTNKVTPIILSEKPAMLITEKDVNFYDYDGTLLYSYTKSEFLALTELPANPTHTGLTAQGWNWSLSDAKDYVTEYGMLDIGQIYTTTSGLIEVDIETTPYTGLVVELYNFPDATYNWGDGITDQNKTHTYTDYGKYTFTIDTSNTNTSTLFSSSTTTQQKSMVKSVRIPQGKTSFFSFMNYTSLETFTIPNSITEIPSNAFYELSILKAIILPNGISKNWQYKNNFTFHTYNLKAISLPNIISYPSNGSFLKECYQLTRIALPQSIESLPNNAFENCFSLTSIVLPNNLATLGSYIFKSCYKLTSIKLPNTITSIPSGTFKECYSLSSITIPNSVTEIGDSAFQNCRNLSSIIIPAGIATIQANTFQGCFKIKVFDFTSANSVPTLNNINAFMSTSGNKINALMKIVVPDSLYETWIAESNWTSLADFIIKESDYNAS